MSKGTTIRGIRIPDELWDAARGKASADGRNISEVIREALESYVSDAPPVTVTRSDE